MEVGRKGIAYQLFVFTSNFQLTTFNLVQPTMSNPNQEIIESRLATYIDGELDANERLEIEQHLQQNPQYRRVIDDLGKQRDMLRGLPREAAPLDLAEAFTNQLERSVLLDGKMDDGRSQMRIYAFPRILAAAAIVLLTVGLAAIVYKVLPDRSARVVAVSSPGARAPAASNPALPEDKSSEEKVAGCSQRMRKLVEDKLKSDPQNGGARPDRKTAFAVAAAPETSFAARSNAALAEKNSAREASAVYALGTNRGGPEHQFQESRDAELDQLARNVSNDPRVKELFAGESDVKAGLGDRGAIPQNARVLVVRANDPRQVENELATFFSRDNIEWRPAPQPVELALNTSLSQKSDEALRNSGTANKREIELKALDSESGLAQKDKLSALAKAIAPAPVAADAPVNRKSQNQPVAAAPGAAADPARADGAKEKTELRDAANGIATSPGTNANAAAGFNNRGFQQGTNQGLEGRQAFAPNAAPVDNMYRRPPAVAPTGRRTGCISCPGRPNAQGRR